MAPRKKDPEAPQPKKKEFGTGLRAQLERRQADEAPKPEAQQPNVELRFELTARPADAEPVTIAASNGATDELRKELAAALAREQKLSIERHEQAESKLRELKSFDRDRSKFASELEKQSNALADRERQLTRAEQELQARERAGV